MTSPSDMTPAPNIDALIERLRMDSGHGIQPLCEEAAAALAALRAELEELKQQRRDWLDNDITARTMKSQEEDIMRLEAERDAALADAKRYRWLRDPNNGEAEKYVRYYIDPEELDREIDAALAAKEK